MYNSRSKIQKLTAEIKTFARELGFIKIGFSKASKCISEYDRFSKWINQGYYGQMSWIANSFESRLDPFQLLPGVKTVISVAMNYFNSIDIKHEKGNGRISRYAWGNDYHDVLMNRMIRLFNYISEKLPDSKYKICVDTSPVLEKYWAQNSGIGWRGKHSIIINEEYGSWIFLGEILINKEFEYDAPDVDKCGNCNLCVEACPTQAIVEPYVLDASKCISYLTIESKNEFSPDEKKNLGNWIYGCDICQEVCPWNQKSARQTKIKDFYARKEIVSFSLNSILNLTEKDFKKLFKNNPVLRTGFHLMKRNILALM